MNVIDLICRILLLTFGVLTAFRWFYMAVGIFAKAKKYPETDKLYRYGILVCARNEEKVIGQLIDSILMQTYPQDLVKVFVICDGCTDGTARVARERGAVVYEKDASPVPRKGFALEALISYIKRDHGLESFDGFFVLDADNLVDRNFIAEMNKAFAAGNKVVTAYRNTKNFDTNTVSSGYGIHFYANTACFHRPRTALGLGTHLTGTGYLFATEIIPDGWHFTNLTEDDEFSMILAHRGIKVAFCEAAEFYDEQPVDLGTAFRQRLRWARGRLTAFVMNFGKAVSLPFKIGFTGYDLFWHYFPVGMATWLIGIIYPAVSIAVSIAKGGACISGILITIGQGILMTYIHGLVTGIFAAVKERRHIRCGGFRLAFYVAMSPWFILSDMIHFLIAVFIDVRWSRIEHSDTRTIGDLDAGKRARENGNAIPEEERKS
ncbi:MAG: glycosyltransferase family 2 protein [Clostridia bacterium]|nr:glycosyltransferase family 2 protein [Clostridia bacterium]